MDPNCEFAVEIRDLVKEYPMNRRGGLIRTLRSSRDADLFRALDGLTVSFPVGKKIGLIGLNGSGKSTLSSIISGIAPPSSGTVKVNGTVSMLNTKLGLNSHLTGRESIRYKCLLLGFSHTEISVMEPEIIDFADIGRFIDQPVHTYSSGMKARLGFAISSQLKTDILVVDEALSVGDDSFADRCSDWMRAYCAQGNTVIFVSHSLSTVRAFCDEILWLHKGHQVAFGPTDPILDAYVNFTKAYKTFSAAEKETLIPDYADYRSAPVQKESKRIIRNG